MLRRYFVKNDILLALALLLAGILSLAALRISAGHPGGFEVVVRTDGKLTGRYPLHEDLSLELDSPWGHNTLEISRGQVSITDSDCAGRDCVRSGKIGRPGECILCLPHRLSVVIEGRDPAIPDTVSY